MEEIESGISVRMWIGAAVVLIVVVALGIILFTRSKSVQNSSVGGTQNSVEILPTATPIPTNTPAVTPTPEVAKGSKTTTTTTQQVYYYYPLTQEQGSQSQSLGNGMSQSQTLGNLTQTQN